MMDPASKICGASKDVNQEDRISNLPSCLIGHILSLLPTTEDAVATSVLSKQWKNHWTLISRLEFDDFKVRLLEFHGSPSGAKPKRTFTNFVYHILQCRSLRITSFRIECYQSYDASHVISWVSMVLRMTNIRELDISVPLEKPVMHPWNLFICDTEKPVMLPWNLFICDTLVKINLGRYFVIDVPASVNLPCLKVLSLDYVKLLDNDSISRLLGGCPVLEELSLGRCIGEQVEVVNIFVPSLTSLNLTYLRYDRVSRIKIVLKTPKLSYLVIDDNVIHCYEMKDANNLSQAKIEFSIWEDVDEIQRESLHGLLKAISKVKSLEFGDNIMQAILSCKFELPEFHNVVELKFGYPNVHTTAKMLPTLLKLMPCLTSLTLDQGFGYDGSYNERRVTFAPLEDVPDCLVLCLKKFEIRKFKGSNNEQTMLEYILKNAKVLEKLVICDLYDSGIDMPRASSIISQIPRASPICKIELLQ